MECKAIFCETNMFDENEAAFKQAAIWSALGAESFAVAPLLDWSWNEVDLTMRLYTEYYPGGTLQELLEQERNAYPLIPTVAIRIAIDICEGMRSCHIRRIVHRNLQPCNILLRHRFTANGLAWAQGRRAIYVDNNGGILQQTNLDEICLYKPLAVISNLEFGFFFAHETYDGHHGRVRNDGPSDPDSWDFPTAPSTASDIARVGSMLDEILTPSLQQAFVTIPALTGIDEYFVILFQTIQRCKHCTETNEPPPQLERLIALLNEALTFL